jgi:PAS domain S-box-containing protein
MESERKKIWTCLLLWPVLAGSLWVANDIISPISIGFTCLIFCLMGCLQTLWHLYVRKKPPHNNNNIADKKSCYETLINNTEDTILLLDTKGTIRLINTTGAERLGVDPETLIGKNAFELLSETIREFRYNKFQYVLTHKKSVRFIDERNGISFDHLLTPVFDCSTNVIGVAIYARDITQLIKIEEQLKSARQEAERANAAKSIFLTHVSHELRTPLNVISGHTQILQSVTSLKNDDQKSLAIIFKNVEFIISLINDLLDISTIETQNMSLSIDVFELNEFLGYISDIAMMYKHEKGIDFQYHFGKDLPLFVTGDERRLKQVLLNLLMNAFKYTEKGHVFLQVIKQDESILFRVEDTGMGIDESLIANIFEPFYRLANQAEGFGLGLSIARHLVEMMGGKLQVESEIGKGSTFWFRLFLEPAKSKKNDCGIITDPLPTIQVFEKKVLIVDDLKENRIILKAMIKPLGFEIYEADTGESALTCIKQGFIPDLILVDLVMPVMDGFEFVDQFKNDYPELNTKVVAVSASHQLNSDKSSTFDARLPKPIQKKRLMKILSEQLNIQWQSQDSSGAKPKISDTETVIPPDQHTRKRLIDYARNGHITDIKDEIRNLEEDSQFKLFINKIDVFITDLDFDGLIDYLNKLTVMIVIFRLFKWSIVCNCVL